MKATIDFDDALYRRLKIEAARRGRTVRDLVAEGVRHVLDTTEPGVPAHDVRPDGPETPPWFGMLRQYAQGVSDHSMSAVRASIARGRRGECP
jgi:hypothetical protein